MSQLIQPVAKAEDVDSYVKETLRTRNELDDDPFIVVDLSEIQERYEEWQRVFPDVEPFFAVKAQHNANTLKLLASNGCGFDVASLGEIRSVLAENVPTTRVIYAQPYKQPSHLVYTLERGILSVCDSVDEIRKIGDFSNQVSGENCRPEILLRILPDDKENDLQSSLSSKFGAPLRALDDLMKTSKESNVAVVGISFHIGSHCHSAEPYLNTMRLSRVWWDRLVSDYGAELKVLDIGGGFPGERGSEFEKMARLINREIEEIYGDVKKDIRVIAEPGRYMVTSSLSSVVNVIAEKGAGEFVLNTGVYGGLSHSKWDMKAARGSKPYRISHNDDGEQDRGNEVLNCSRDKNKEELSETVFWGPTCDSSDRLINGYHVPGVKRGDWIVFPDLGAYCSNIMTNFNGFHHPKMHFIYTEKHKCKIEEFFRPNLLLLEQ